MRIALLCFCSLVFGSLVAQEDIFLSTLGGQLYRLNLEDCDYDLLGQMPVSSTDISFHPNGNLYAIGSGGQIYVIDVAAQTSQLLHTFSGGPGQFFTALTISAEGFFYASGLSGGLWRYDLASNNGNYLGNIGYGAEGDLTFYEGDLYMAATDDNIIAVNIQSPSASSIAVDGNVNGRIFGIVSYAASCDSISVYALTNNSATIYEVDFATGSLVEYCSIPLQVSGGASTFEFLGSNPVIIGEPEADDFSCSGSAGILDVPASGGVGALQYSLDGLNYQPSPVFTGLPLAQYTIYVTDEVGCTRTRLFSPNGGPLNLNPIVENTSCGFDNGRVALNLTGGQAPYVIELNGLIYQDSFTLSNLAPGNYDLLVREANGCELATTFGIQSSNGLSLESLEVSPASCELPNGSIELIGSGGSEPYDITLNETPLTDLNQLQNLLAGSYRIEITDNENCTLSIEAEVAGSPAVSLELLDRIAPDCEGATGQIRLNASGGTGTLSLLNNGRPAADPNLLSGLEADTYELRLADSLGCFDTLTVSLPSGRCPIYFPTAFSPNLDGINDYFAPMSTVRSGIEIVTFQVYDRWGALLFDAPAAPINDRILRWEGDRVGDQLGNGTYLYLVTARYADGGEEIFSGAIQLLR